MLTSAPETGFHAGIDRNADWNWIFSSLTLAPKWSAVYSAQTARQAVYSLNPVAAPAVYSLNPAAAARPAALP